MHPLSTDRKTEAGKTYASSLASSRNVSGADLPETKSVMTVMNSPKMRFCRAIPAPEAMAATMAIACRVYSRGPANVKILYAGVSRRSHGTPRFAGVSYSITTIPTVFLLGGLRRWLGPGGGRIQLAVWPRLFGPLLVPVI